MLAIISLISSIKNYIEVVHKTVDTNSTLKVNNYTDFGSILTFSILSLKTKITNLFTNNNNISIHIPHSGNSMLSDISIYNNTITNTLSYPESLYIPYSSLLINIIEKLVIGLFNSIFLLLPSSISHLIIIRRLLVDGSEAGYIAGLGTIAGNTLSIASILFGWRLFVIPWLSMDIFRYLLGFTLLVNYIWNNYKSDSKGSNKESLLKIFLLNFTLSLTEQTSIYPFLSNLSLTANSTTYQSVALGAKSLSEFVLLNISYLLGIVIGSLALLHGLCLFIEKPGYNLYLKGINILNSKNNPLLEKIKSFIPVSNINGNIYNKVVNFSFLYISFILLLTSIPYYGLDYTLANPMGFVSEDRLLINNKNLKEFSFLNTKASDKNTRRNKGRHARRERWKRRVRKYRTFDTSLYNNGVYDLFTIEDLNYGFDRFWYRRKMRNHKTRFKFFPGIWMRNFKKQLSKPRLENYSGPRNEFFRMIFEGIYHPTFHSNLANSSNNINNISLPSINNNNKSLVLKTNINNNSFYRKFARKISKGLLSNNLLNNTINNKSVKGYNSKKLLSKLNSINLSKSNYLNGYLNNIKNKELSNINLLNNNSKLIFNNNNSSPVDTLKLYYKKIEAFKRKLRYYTPTVFRKFRIDNNAAHFRILSNKYFYYYRPGKRWEKTMKVGSLRKARRKNSRTSRKLVYNGKVVNNKTNNITNNNSITNNSITNNNITKLLFKKPTSDYTIAGKRATRYRYQIFKDILENWYYSPRSLRGLLLKLDVDSFIKRQPYSYFYSNSEKVNIEEKRLYNKEIYNSSRLYNKMDNYKAMKSTIGNTKSFSNRFYYQQFIGTFKKIRHLFSITPKSLSTANILKFDQALYNNNRESYGRHEELSNNIITNNLIGEATNILSNYSNKAAHIRNSVINNLINNNNYSDLKTYIYTNNNLPINIIPKSNNLYRKDLLEKDKEALLNTILSNKVSNLAVNILKNSKNGENSGIFLKNYINTTVSLRDKRSSKKAKKLIKRIKHIQKLISKATPTNTNLSNKYNTLLSNNSFTTGVRKAIKEGSKVLTNVNSNSVYNLNAVNRVYNNNKIKGNLALVKDLIKNSNKTPFSLTTKLLSITNSIRNNINNSINKSLTINRIAKLFKANKYKSLGALKSILRAKENYSNKALRNEIKGITEKAQLKVNKNSKKAALKKYRRSKHKNMKKARIEKYRKLKNMPKRKIFNKSLYRTPIFFKKKANSGIVDKLFNLKRYLYLKVEKPLKGNINKYKDKYLNKVTVKKSNRINLVKDLYNNRNLYNKYSNKFLGSYNYSYKLNNKTKVLNKINKSYVPFTYKIKKGKAKVTLYKHFANKGIKTNKLNKPSISYNINKINNLINNTKVLLYKGIVNNKDSYYSNISSIKDTKAKVSNANAIKALDKVVNNKKIIKTFNSLYNNKSINKNSSKTKNKKFNNTIREALLESIDISSINTIRKKVNPNLDSSKENSNTNNNTAIINNIIDGLNNGFILPLKRKKNSRSRNKPPIFNSTVTKKAKIKETINNKGGNFSCKEVKSKNNKARSRRALTKRKGTLANNTNKVRRRTYTINGDTIINKKQSIKNIISVRDYKKLLVSNNSQEFNKLLSLLNNSNNIEVDSYKPLALSIKNGNTLSIDIDNSNSNSINSSSSNNNNNSILAKIYNSLLLKDNISLYNNKAKFLISTKTTPFFAGWDNNSNTFVVNNIMLSRREAGNKLEINNNIKALRSLVNKDNNNSNNIIEFSMAPLKGMNVGTILYSHIPVTTYDPDSLFSLGLDGFSPIGWKRFNFRHSLLRSWLTTNNNNIDNITNSNKDSSYGIVRNKVISTVNNKSLLLSKLEGLYSKGMAHNLLVNNVGNNRNSKNIARRLKKRNKRVKRHPRLPSLIPSGALINNVLPVHYIFVFSNRGSRLPRNRYIKRKLSLLKAKKKTNSYREGGLLNNNLDFTLRKRVKTRRRYHINKENKSRMPVFPRRSKFYNNLVNNNNNSNMGEIIGVRPYSGKSKKSYKEIVIEGRKLRSNKKSVNSKDQPSIRVKQLRRRVLRQTYRVIPRYRPIEGGLLWPGDYYKLERTRIPLLNKDNNTNKDMDKGNSGNSRKVRSTKRKNKKRRVNMWHIQPKKYLLDKSNKKAIRKKLNSLI